MDTPIYHLPFGTNWFLPQIVAFSPCKTQLALGINNTVHIMNFSKKSPLKTLVPPCGSRVHCIQYTESLHIVTSTHLYTYQNHELVSSQLLVIQNPLYCEFPYILSQNGQVQKDNIEIKDFKQKIKFFTPGMLVTESEILNIDPEFNITKKQASQRILYCDKQGDQMVFLLKDKGKFQVRVWEKEWKNSFEVQFKGSLADKPSLCVAIQNESILVTGLKGEIFDIDLHNEKTVLLDADTIDTVNTSERLAEQNELKILYDNPHHKPIYHLYTHSPNEFISLSQDRKVSFWRNKKRYYILDLLSAKYSQIDFLDNQILALSAQNSIRRWTIKAQDNYYSQEISAQLNHLNLKSFCASQEQEGILGFATEFQLGFYDLFAQKLVKVTQELQPIMHTRFVLKQNIPTQAKQIPLILAQQNKASQQKIDCVLMGITQKSLLFLSQEGLFEYDYEMLPEGFQINFIEFQEHLQLLVFGSKDSKLYFFHIPTKNYHHHQLQTQSSVSSISLNEFPLYLCVTNMTRDLLIAQIFIEDGISLEIIKEFKSKNPLIKTCWKEGQLLAVGYKSTGIQVWDSEGNETAYIRGHQGYVTDAKWRDEHTIVSGKQCNLGSEDQSLKVWDIRQIHQKKPPNKKKHKKIKLQ